MNLPKELIFDCPYCKEHVIKVLEKPGYRGFGKSRGSGVTSTYQTTVEGSMLVLGGCEKCGKGKKEVEQALFG